METKIDKLLAIIKQEKKFFQYHPTYHNLQETIQFDDQNHLTIQAVNDIKCNKFNWLKKLTPKVNLFRTKTMLHFKANKIYFHIANLEKSYDYKAVILIDKNSLELEFVKEVLDFDSKLVKTIAGLVDDGVRANIRTQFREDFQQILDSFHSKLML